MNAAYKKTHTGLTLLELIITISIIAILLAVTWPMVQTFVRNQRITAEVNLLIGALNYTRTEAVLQRRPLRLCGGSLAKGCEEQRFWHGDWLLMVDEPSRASEPLRVFSHSGDFFWHWRGAGGYAFIRFKANGMAAGRNGTFTLCHEKEALHQVVVNFAGRIRSQEASANARCD